MTAERERCPICGDLLDKNQPMENHVWNKHVKHKMCFCEMGCSSKGKMAWHYFNSWLNHVQKHGGIEMHMHDHLQGVTNGE